MRKIMEFIKNYGFIIAETAIGFCLIAVIYSGFGIVMVNSKPVIDPKTYVAERQNAVENANAIIEKYKDLDDMDKLTAYYNEIHDLAEFDVEYLDKAFGFESFLQKEADNGIVNVFDNDPDTKSVCLGFANSFKYLCDHSNFNGDVKCHVDTGTIGSKGTEYNHSWNIIKMNGEYYHVDMTWSESDASFASKNFFMSKIDGSLLDYDIPDGSRMVHYNNDLVVFKNFGATLFHKITSVINAFAQNRA